MKTLFRTGADNRAFFFGLILAFIAVAQFSVMTWPLMTNPLTRTLANSQSDIGLEAGFLDVSITDRLIPFLGDRLLSAGAPDGLKISRAAFVSSPLPIILELSLSHLTTGTIALTLLCLIQFILATIVLGCGVRYLTRSYLAGALSASVFLFAQPTYASVTELPSRYPVWLYATILLLAVHHFSPGPKIAHFGLLFRIAILLGLTWAPMVSIHTVIMCLAFLLFDFRMKSANLWRIISIPLLVGLLFNFAVFISISGIKRNSLDIDQLGINPLNYLLPGQWSDYWTKYFITLAQSSGTIVSNGIGNNYYLGLPLIAVLSSIVFSLLAKEKIMRQDLADTLDFSLLKIIGLLMLIFVMTALPTKILGIPTPSTLTACCLSIVRRGSASIVPLVTLCAIGVGLLWNISKRLFSPNVARFLAVMIIVLLYVDGSSKPNNSYAYFQEQYSNSKSLEVLRKSPEGLVVHFSTDSGDGTACLLHRFHQQKLVNSCSHIASTNFDSLRPFDDCTSLVKLKTMDVRYILLEKYDLRLSVRTRLEKIESCLTLKSIAYRIVDDDSRSLWIVNDV